MKFLSLGGILASMSRKCNCWDNGPTESLWGRLKVGRLYGRRFATRRQAMDEVIDWLTFYNHRKLHSTPGLRQSNDVRATLDSGPAARQAVRTMVSLWSAENRGKISLAKNSTKSANPGLAGPVKVRIQGLSERSAVW